MNIAFPALIILLLILPGAIFRYAYARGSWGWSSPISFRTVSDEVAYSAIFAVGLHLIWLLLASVLEFQADFRALVALVSGNFGAQGQRYERSLDAIALHPAAIVVYFISLFVASAASGRLAHWIVRRNRLDLRTQTFRFKNEWHYLLTGEMLAFKEVAIEPRDVSGVLLSAVIDHAKDSYLYRGIVVDWSFATDGQPDTIRLRFTHRRKLADDRPKDVPRASGEFIPPDERYYEIHGDIFVMRYSELKTLNLDYFFLSEEAADSTNTSSSDAGTAHPA
jgi:hypothetical protein